MRWYSLSEGTHSLWNTGDPITALYVLQAVGQQKAD